MRFFVVGLVSLFSVLTATAQDVKMLSNTSEGVLLKIQNTGASSKTLITADNANDGTALEINGGATGINAGISASYSGLGMSLNVYGPAYATGISGSAYGDEYSYNRAMAFVVGGGNYSGNYGVQVDASGGASSYNYGVYSYTSGGSGSENYGVYSSVSGGSTSIAGFFDGELWRVTDHWISDQKLKTNIRDLQGGLGKIMALRPRVYEMRTEEYKGRLNLPQGEQMGFIAQELETVLPQLVTDGAAPARLTKEERENNVKKESTKFKGVDYTGVIPVLVKAVQEQQAEIEALRAEVQILKASR